MVVGINVIVVVTPGEEADGYTQQGAADGFCLLRPEPLWLFAGERPGRDLIHTGTAPFSCPGSHRNSIIMR